MITMNLTTLPADILHNIALWLPMGQLNRLHINKSLVKGIHNHDRFWNRCYLRDFGHDGIFDDYPEMDWKRRYMRHIEMYTLHDNDHNQIPRTKGVATGGDALYILGTDNMVRRRELNTCERWVDTGIVPDAAVICVHKSEEYVLTKHGTIVNRGRPKKWPLAKQMVKHNGSLLLVTLEDRVFITVDTVGVYIDMRVKYISLSGNIGACIDRDDNIWFTTSTGYDLNSVTWKRFFGMTGKRVACDDKAMMIIDLEDNLWVYGKKNKWGRLGVGHFRDVDELQMIKGIKGLDIHMSWYKTWIIDVHHNLWTAGPRGDGTVCASPEKQVNCKMLNVNIGNYYWDYIGTKIWT